MITDEEFDKAYHLFKDLGLPVIVTSSTHLGLYLNHKLYPNDTEIDFTLERKDFLAKKDILLNTKEYKDSGKTDFKSITGAGIMYFKIGNSMIPLTQYTIDDYVSINLTGDTFVFYPKEIFLPWKPLVYKDYELLQPNKPEESFVFIYGKNWKEEAGTDKWRHGDIYKRKI